MSTAIQRQHRRIAAALAATETGGALSRARLHALGIDRHAIAAEVKAGRWTLLGRHSVAVAPLEPSAWWWRALWETSSRAALDGVSALDAAGMTGYADPVIHVSLPPGVRAPRVDGVARHHLPARLPDELWPVGLPRVRPEIAAVRAAHWADTDRQGALLLVLPVQQRLVHPAHLVAACDQITSRRRHTLVSTLVRDIAGGAHSLGELDFARICRRWSLPEPSRQVVRRGPRGRIYLDVRWDDIGLVIEIDGIHHGLGLAPVDDALRQNQIALTRDMVLRIPLLGLRLEEESFMPQVVTAHQVLQHR